jgi:hypothetical protein
VKGLDYEEHHAVFSSFNYFCLLGQKVFSKPHSQTPSIFVLPEVERPGFMPIQQKMKLCFACFIPLYMWWQTGKQCLEQNHGKYSPDLICSKVLDECDFNM